MTKKEFMQYLDRIKGKYEFTGGVTKEIIKEFENQLHFPLPADYCWLLQNYGSIRVPGISILGIAYDNFNMALECIIKNRLRGLPEKYIPILDFGEYIYCINCNTSDNDNIVNWEPYGETLPENGDLFEFITSQFDEALED